MGKKILVVDDERNLCELIKYNLEKEGFEAICIQNGEEVEQIISTDKIDLIVLDISLPGITGLEVCRKLQSKIPIIFLTAKGGEIDKILGLELGADDYMTKPFSPRELIARIKSILRRWGGNILSSDEIFIDEKRLCLNLLKHEVSIDGEKIELKPKEFDLLKTLVNNRGKVLTRDKLLELIWGYEFEGNTRTVDVHMRRLRQKIEKDPSNPAYLKSVHGIGYKFASEQ